MQNFFAHAMAAQLLSLIQIFVAISSLEPGWGQIEIHIKIV